MDVFLIPLGGDRYELYCEAPVDETEPDPDPSQRGLFARLKLQFSQVLAASEHARNRRASREEDEPTGFFARVKARALAWVADAIAEQRLLWHLRHQTDVTLHFPPDMTSEEAMQIARTALQRDADRHRWWLAIDGVLMLLSGLLILVPGPNVIGYYFAFRVVGHYLSWRGARQGLDVVAWQTHACEPLAEVRDAMAMTPHQRERTLHDVASRLRLDHLATFIERVAFPRAPRAQSASSS
jgi:hypothetical protein